MLRKLPSPIYRKKNTPNSSCVGYVNTIHKFTVRIVSHFSYFSTLIQVARGSFHPECVLEIWTRRPRRVLLRQERTHAVSSFGFRCATFSFGPSGDCVNLSFAAFRTSPIAESTCTGRDIADLDSKPHRLLVPYAVGCFPTLEGSC